MHGIRNLIAYQSGGKSRFPTYVEYVEELTGHSKKDKRTAASIKSDLLEKLKVRANEC